MAREKSQVDRLLDAGVYAPIGFLLTRNQAMADFAAAGRKQIAFSRSLGRAALKGLSLGAQAPTKPPPSTPAASTPAASKTSTAKKAAPAPTAAAVDGYGEMTAKQAIAYIADCSPAQAEWIRETESSAKKRVTVLRALDARV